MPDRVPTRDGRNSRKSEVISIRLDPRLKYLAELAARRQRRPLSSYVEWAIEQSLKIVGPEYGSTLPSEPSLADVASLLWDVDEADRFAKLALAYPELLTHEEQILWKLIRECGLLWRGGYGGPDKEWQWRVKDSSLIWERLRKHWPTFCKVARGELPPTALPEWTREEEKFEAKPGDDEIPF